MKTYRQREKQGTKVSDTSKGPDEAKIKVTDVNLLRAFVCFISFYFISISSMPFERNEVIFLVLYGVQ